MRSSQLFKKLPFLMLVILSLTKIHTHELYQTTELLYQEDYSRRLIPVTVLKIDPSIEKIHFSLAKHTNEFGGMHYDQINIYRVLKNGKRLYATTSPDTMRDDLLTLKEHELAFTKRAQIFAISSYGNLIMDGFLAGYSNGEIITRFDEPKDRSYYSLVVSKDGNLEFKDVNYSNGNFDSESQMISGQAVVKRGSPIKASSIYEQFDNIKHLFHLPFLQCEGRTIHFAVDQLTKDKSLLSTAAKGEKVILELKAHQISTDGVAIYTDFPENVLITGLDEKGYHLVSSFEYVLHPGEYALSDNQIAICFLPAINAHHFIALDQEGYLLDIIVQGKSNREGISLEKAGEWLINRYKVKDAIVIDNGGDCTLIYQNKNVAPSFNGRTKFASAIVYYIVD